MNFFTVALVQYVAPDSLKESLKRGLAAVCAAKKQGADLVLFPELWSIGYRQSYMTLANALDHQSSYIQAFCDKARELEIAIGLTYLGKGREKPTNNMALIDATGTVVMDYAKVHICSFTDGTELALEPGCSFPVVDMRYARGTVLIGAMICFDREFPESARCLAAQGAELILVPNSCEMATDQVLGDVRLAQLRARAFENMVGIALANYSIQKNDGHSCAIDVSGAILAGADQHERLLCARFDLDRIRRWHQNEGWGVRGRRPECYGVLEKP